MRQSNYVRLIVSVPITHADAIREALGQAGAGQQGNYSYCSGSYPSTGRFKPLTGANPAIGRVGELETVAEETITTICHQDLLPQVVAAIKKVHPYEAVPIDIIPRFEV